MAEYKTDLLIVGGGTGGCAAASESHGCTRSHSVFRQLIREYYYQNYPLRTAVGAGKNIGTTYIRNGYYRVPPIEWKMGESAGTLTVFYCNRRVCSHQVATTPGLIADL